MIQFSLIQILFHEFLGHPELILHRLQYFLVQVHGRMILCDRTVVRIAESLLGVEPLFVKVVYIDIAEDLTYVDLLTWYLLGFL